MITITPKAKAHIQKQVAKESGNYFRLWVKSTGCSGYMYMPEIVTEKKDGDIEICTFDGVTVILDKAAVSFVDGTEIDYIEKMLGFKQLVFNNPKATGLCGCGESFKLQESTHD